MIPALLLLAALAEPAGPSVPPRAVTWEEMARDVFDPQWILPAHLDFAPGERGAPVDLARTLRRLAADRFAPHAVDPEAPRCLGDVVLAVRRAGGDARARAAVMERVRRAQPALAADLEPWIDELLCDERLASAAWNPDDDDACDGIAFARPLTLAGVEAEPWARLGGQLVQQAAVLVRADLEAIKAAENDYAAYPRRPRSTYVRIGPVERSYVRGADPQGQPFAALRMLFESDLPFPFSTFTCDLHVLNRFDDRERVVCDVYSTSRDFIWLAGRDHFFPVQASDGAWVGTLIVRWHGFDLRNVPDGDDARRGALRSSLGSLKRDSEALFRRLGRPPRTIDGAIPDFEVRGKPQR